MPPRTELPGILAKRSDVLSPRTMRVIEDLAGDWRRLDERIEGLSGDIISLVEQDPACERLMTVPGIGPIISSAMVAAIGSGDVCQGPRFRCLAGPSGARLAGRACQAPQYLLLQV
jgi:transposase